MDIEDVGRTLLIDRELAEEGWDWELASPKSVAAVHQDHFSGSQSNHHIGP